MNRLPVSVGVLHYPHNSKGCQSRVGKAAGTEELRRNI